MTTIIVHSSFLISNFNFTGSKYNKGLVKITIFNVSFILTLHLDS